MHKGGDRGAQSWADVAAHGERAAEHAPRVRRQTREEGGIMCGEDWQEAGRKVVSGEHGAECALPALARRSVEVHLEIRRRFERECARDERGEQHVGGVHGESQASSISTASG